MLSTVRLTWCIIETVEGAEKKERRQKERHRWTEIKTSAAHDECSRSNYSQATQTV